MGEKRKDQTHTGVIPSHSGQIIYLDADTPKLKALLIRGGHLIFDDNQDITLRAEYILVLDGGSITVSIRYPDRG